MRPSWDTYFNALASMISTRSTCQRQQHGAIIVKDKQLLSTGFNGAPSGVTSCDEREICVREEKGAKPGEHYEWCCALHAEQNAIIQAAKHGINIADATLYCTNSPCIICSKMLINAGVQRIIYQEGYPDLLSMEMLAESGVEVLEFSQVVGRSQGDRR